MNIHEQYPGKLIKAVDLKGQDLPVTIRGITIEDFGDGKKPVLQFHEIPQALALNKTNANLIAEQLGEETNYWIGKRIILYSAKVDFQGRRVDAIRIRDTAAFGQPQPRQPQPQAPQQPTQVSAKRAAWDAFQAAHPESVGSPAMGDAWRAAVKAYFPGKVPEMITDDQWMRFAADGFRPAPAQPPFSEPTFGADDIPF